MSRITVPVSFGELVDKLTILEIKSARIVDPKKLGNVRHELTELVNIWTASASEFPDIRDARARLKSANETLWDIEDQLRQLESKSCFDEDFVKLARAVYTTNDLRSTIKKEINQVLSSEFVEEKSYENYR